MSRRSVPTLSSPFSVVYFSHGAIRQRIIRSLPNGLVAWFFFLKFYVLLQTVLFCLKMSVLHKNVRKNECESVCVLCTGATRVEQAGRLSFVWHCSFSLSLCLSLTLSLSTTPVLSLNHSHIL